MPKKPSHPTATKAAAVPLQRCAPSGTRHPCIRVFGRCDYGEECCFAQYPRNACLRHLKGTCNVKNCSEPHVVGVAVTTAPAASGGVVIVAAAAAATPMTKKAAPGSTSIARPWCSAASIGPPSAASSPVAVTTKQEGAPPAAVPQPPRHAKPPPQAPTSRCVMRDAVAQELSMLHDLSFERHPCLRRYKGVCKFGDTCYFAAYPRAMCLSYLKKLVGPDGGAGNARRCDVADCTDPHDVKEAARCSATKVTAATVERSSIAEQLRHVVQSDADIAAMPKHPCLRVFQGTCTATERLGRCHYDVYPQAMCLPYLKTLFEAKKSDAYNPNAIACNQNRCPDCHNVDDLRRVLKRKVGRPSGATATNATAITMGDCSPKFRTIPGKTYADILNRDRHGQRTTDASSVLAATTPSSLHTWSQRASAAVAAADGGCDDPLSTYAVGSGASTVSIKSCYEDLVQRQGMLADGQTLEKLDVFPVPSDFKHAFTDDTIVEMLPVIEAYRPIDPTLQKHHLSALYFNSREDFVASLRRAVRLVQAEWHRSQHHRTPFSWDVVHGHDMHHDVRHYGDVTFNGGQMTPAGLVFHLHIDLSNYSRRVRWERRLLNGSLLLLSFDDFRPEGMANATASELLMATVVKTHTDMGTTPQMCGRPVFTGDVDVQIININVSQRMRLLKKCKVPVCVLESPVFFLPYQQSLDIVKSMTTINDQQVLGGLLLSQHQTPNAAATGPPKFLEGKTLDLSRVLAARQGSIGDGAPPKLLFSPGNPVSCRWPGEQLAVWSPDTEDAVHAQNQRDGSHLHVLDGTQARAMEHLLSAKVAIVQGPPGTGKTFIGEKYIQTLYHNRDVLEGPILLACETNHAVDSVLNGVRHMMGDVAFVKDVVRLGTRSKDPMLQSIQLVSLLQSQRTREEGWNHRRHWSTVECTEQQLTTLQEMLERLDHLSRKVACYPRNLPDADDVRGDKNGDVISRILEELNALGTEKQHEVRRRVCLDTATLVQVYAHRERVAMLAQGAAVKEAHRRADARRQDVKQRFDGLFQTPGDGSTMLDKIAAQPNYEAKLLERRGRILRDLSDTRVAYNQLLSTDIPWNARWESVECGDIAIRQVQEWITHNAALLATLNRASLVQLLKDDVERKRVQYAKWFPFYQRVCSAIQHQDELREYLAGNLDCDVVEAQKSVNEFNRLASLPPLEAACILHLITKAKEPPSPQPLPSLQSNDGSAAAASVDTIDVDRAMVDECALRDEHNRERDIGDFLSEDIKRQASVDGKHHHPLIARLMGQIKDLIDAITDDYCKLCDSKRSQDILKTVGVLANKFILAGTISSVTREAAMLRYLKPKVVMIEEAAEVREESIWSCLTNATQQLVLIGDHMQLSPKISEDRLRRNYFGVSLMERLVHGVGATVVTITTQRRMHPDISACVKGYYERSNITIKDHRSTESRPLIGTTRTPTAVSSRRVVFVDAGGVGTQNESGSWKNDRETCCVVRLARLLRAMHPSKSIAVLTMYRGQLLNIQHLSKLEGLRFGAGADDVRIATVDDFQGEESDIVILSPVRTPNTGLGFLNAENRWCVALSRARAQMFVVGSTATLAHTFRGKANHVMYDFHAYVKDLAGRALCVRDPSELSVQLCSNERHTILWKGMMSSTIALPQCTALCDQRRPCGHKCNKRCHDGSCTQTETVCLADCGKQLPCGHVCKKKCSKPCGPCLEKVVVECQHCHRTSSIPCNKHTDAHARRSDDWCTLECLCRLPCGHACKLRCGESAWPNAVHRCDALVARPLPHCGHAMDVPCAWTDDELSSKAGQCQAQCQAQCDVELECRHNCAAKCGSCHTKLCHPPLCQQPVKVCLPCGHTADTTCSTPLPSCGKCARRGATGCGDPDAALVTFDVTVGPCRTRRKCGHFCLGLEGQPCPSYCALCSEDAHLQPPTNLGTQVQPGKERQALTVIQRASLAAVGAMRAAGGTRSGVDVVKPLRSPDNDDVSKRIVETPCCHEHLFVGDLQTYLRAKFNVCALMSIPCFCCGMPVVEEDDPGNHRQPARSAYPMCEAYSAYLNALRRTAGAMYEAIIKEQVNAKSAIERSVKDIAMKLTGSSLEEIEGSLVAPLANNTKKKKSNKALLAEVRRQRSAAIEQIVGDSMAHFHQGRAEKTYIEAMTILFVVVWRVKEEFLTQINDQSARLVQLVCRVMRLVHRTVSAEHLGIGADVEGWIVRFCAAYAAGPILDNSEKQDNHCPLLSPETIAAPVHKATAALKEREQMRQLLHEVVEGFLIAVDAACSIEHVLRQERQEELASNARQPKHIHPKRFPVLSDACVEAIFERCERQIGQDGFVRNRGTATFAKNQCLLTGCSAFQRFAAGVQLAIAEQQTPVAVSRHQPDIVDEQFILDPNKTAIVYHGTSRGAIAPICCRGFDTEGRRRCLHGKGEYFGKTMTTSLDYVEQGGEEMLVCLVLEPGACRHVRHPPAAPNFVVADNRSEQSFALPVGVVDYKNSIHAQQLVWRANTFQDCDYPIARSDPSLASADSQRIVKALVDAVVSPIVSHSSLWRATLKAAVDATVSRHPSASTRTLATASLGGCASQGAQLHVASGRQWAEPDAQWYVCLGSIDEQRRHEPTLFQTSEASPACPNCRTE